LKKKRRRKKKKKKKKKSKKKKELREKRQKLSQRTVRRFTAGRNGFPMVAFHKKPQKEKKTKSGMR